MGARVVGKINIGILVDEHKKIPHITREIFHSYGIGIDHIAKIIDFKRGTVKRVLNGDMYPSNELDFNLKCLAGYLQNYGKTGPFEDMEIDIMT